MKYQVCVLQMKDFVVQSPLAVFREHCLIFCVCWLRSILYYTIHRHLMFCTVKIYFNQLLCKLF